VRYFNEIHGNFSQRGGSQGASQGGSSSARSFDLARPGVAPPLREVSGYFQLTKLLVHA